MAICSCGKTKMFLGSSCYIKQYAPNVALVNRWVEEKVYVLLAKHAPMVLQMHFIDVIVLFLFIDKTTFLHAQF
jgi:hypothetical protein